MIKKNVFSFLIPLLCIILLFLSYSTTYGQTGINTRPNVPTPPGQAIDACKNKRAYSKCQFQAPKKNISGICINIQSTLACVPENHFNNSNKKNNSSSGYSKDTKSDIKRSLVIDTGQYSCFNNYTSISCPKEGESFSGQDAQYKGKDFSYRDNKDGTITDLNTGLMWQKSPDFDREFTWDEALVYAKNATIAGYDDWRLPTIKELVSIAKFDGNVRKLIPYIDTRYFDFEFPDTSKGNRIIDGQFYSSTEYTDIVTLRGNRDACFFGFNFADGHLKCYPKYKGHKLRTPKFFIRLVRGNSDQLKNKFIDNNDGTITDLSTGLMWQKSDDRIARNWGQALSYAENLNLAGHDDWRLPDIKELQNIVDYKRTDPAIDPVFITKDPKGWFWSGTSYEDVSRMALYVAFGKAVDYRGFDVHGAGAVRGDPKFGNKRDYPYGMGPQSDQVRIYNYVRCVRTAKNSKNKEGSQQTN